MTSKRDHLDTVQSVLRGEGLNIPDDQIFAGPYHEGMPDPCITMRETGGVGALDTFGPGGESIQQPAVQVRIRHDSRELGKSDADDCWALLHDMDPSGYSPPDMLQSSPIYLGTDEDSRHEWSVNVELYISE